MTEISAWIFHKIESQKMNNFIWHNQNDLKLLIYFKIDEKKSSEKQLELPLRQIYMKYTVKYL